MAPRDRDWSREEVEATVADYLSMLGAELREEEYSKTEHRRALQRLLNRETVRLALPMGPLPAGGPADTGAAKVENSTAIRLNRTTGRSRREERVTEHLHDRRGTRSGAGSRSWWLVDCTRPHRTVEDAYDNASASRC